MIKRDIIANLISMLDRPTIDLVSLIVTFLKKLCIFEENKNEMLKQGESLIAKLVKLIPSDNQELQELVFRFLLNLSHDPRFRAFMVKSGLLGKLVGLFENGTLTELVIPLIYQLSLDEKHRSYPGFTDCIPIVCFWAIN